MFQPKICSVFRFHEKFDKKKYHNTKFSTPVYNVYPEDVVNPIFTNWKITSKKDVVGDLPSECEIRKGILFVNKNIFIFTRVTETDVTNIISTYTKCERPWIKIKSKENF